MNHSVGPTTDRAPKDEAKSRFIVNVGFQVSYLAINTVIMLWFIPFLIGRLGVAAYGMTSLANSLISYSMIVSMGVEVTINRFLAIDIHKGNYEAANRTFNTALAMSFLACAILVIPAGLVTYFFPQLFNVPEGLELATQFLFASACVATLVAIISGNFGVSSVIMHRFDLRNTLRVLTAFTRVGAVIVCFWIWAPSLWYVAIGLILAAFVQVIGDVLLWRRLTPELHIEGKNIDRGRLGELFELGGWETVNQFGFLLLTQTNLLIVNAFFGSESTGRFGALIPFTSLVSTTVAYVSEVVRPAIMARYAAGDIAAIQRISRHSIKLIGVGLALPIGLLCGLAGPLLNLWLGKAFVDMEFLMIPLAGHLTVNASILPLIYVITAYNRVKEEALATLVLGVVNIIVCIALARWSGWGVAGVAFATAIIWTIRNVVVLSSFGAMLMGLRWWAFYAPLAIAALGTVGVTVAGKFAAELWWPASWLELGAEAAAIGLLYSVVAYAICLDGDDRSLLWSFASRARRV